MGSKSERDAVLLDVGDQRYVLRVRGGTSFGDSPLDDLVGLVIDAEGEMHDQYFDLSNWSVHEG